MWVMHLGVALLVWIPSGLHAQPCSAPSLERGYFLPVQESYPHEAKISYACDDGYKPAGKGWWATSVCLKGKWWLTPQCIENPCSEPPKILNAVINQDYQEVFHAGSEVEYQCKDGYSTEDGATKKSVLCSAGQWTEGPTCRSPSHPGSDGDAQSIISIDNCGEIPDVPNSETERAGQHSLMYRCTNYYKLVGPETVVCLSNRKWSEVPTCKEDFCQMNTAEHPDLKNVGVKYFKNGETQKMECSDMYTFQNFAVVTCTDGKLQRTGCCNRIQINTGTC